MAKKKVKAVIPEPPTTTTNDLATSIASTPQLQRVPFSKAQYFSLVPLQCISILFSCLNAGQATAPSSSPRISSPGLLLDALIDRPLQFLPFALAGIAIVQIYVGIMLRNMRRRSMGLGKKLEQETSKEGSASAHKDLKKPARAEKAEEKSASKGINLSVRTASQVRYPSTNPCSNSFWSKRRLSLCSLPESSIASPSHLEHRSLRSPRSHLPRNPATDFIIDEIGIS